MLGRRDDQDDAVILALLAGLAAPADRPAPAEPIAIILDRVALQAGDGRDHQLPPAARLQRRQLRGQVDDLRRVEQMRLVDHPSGERREDQVGGEGRAWHERHHHRQAHRQDESFHPIQRC